jgi:hypothetical protein
VNLLEPEALVRGFLRHPPDGFATFVSPEGVPGFQAQFDLTTTTDITVRRKLTALPFYRYWCRLLKHRTCFIGTTVSEYTIFPEDVVAARLVRCLKQRYAPDYPFLIIKDLPKASPLVEAARNALADDIACACAAQGFVLIEGQALAYVDIDFTSLDGYVSRMSPGRRKDIRRKLRAREALAIEAVPCGSDRFSSGEILREYYALYLNVFHHSDLHFDLLSADFFQYLLQDSSSGGVVFEYRQGGRLIG